MDVEQIGLCPRVIFEMPKKDPEHDWRQEFGKLIEVDIVNFTEQEMKRYLILKVLLNF